MKDQLLSETNKYQQGDLQLGITTGQASTSSALVDEDKKHADVRMLQQDGGLFSSGNTDDYEGLVYMCEHAKQRILQEIGAEVPIVRRFACRRNSENASFVALGHNHLADKFIFLFSNGCSDINGLDLQEINLDSRDTATMRNEIKGIVLFLIGDQAILYLQSFSGAQWYLRVGDSCKKVAVIFEYVADAHGFCETLNYVGYNVQNFWQWTQEKFDWQRLLPNISCVERTLKCFEKINLMEDHHEKK